MQLNNDNGSQSERGRPVSKREQNQVLKALMTGKGDTKTDSSPLEKKKEV